MRKQDKPTPRQILSANLKALKEAHPGLDTIKKISERSKVSNGKVGRIYAGTHTTDIDALQQLADAFGLEPWQLLVENLRPMAPPVLASSTLVSELRNVLRDAQPVHSVPAVIPNDEEAKEDAIAKHLLSNPVHVKSTAKANKLRRS